VLVSALRPLGVIARCFASASSVRATKPTIPVFSGLLKSRLEI
jgi:hypothetical protein